MKHLSHFYRECSSRLSSQLKMQTRIILGSLYCKMWYDGDYYFFFAYPIRLGVREELVLKI